MIKDGKDVMTSNTPKKSSLPEERREKKKWGNVRKDTRTRSPRNETKTKWTQNRKKKDREKADLKKSVLSGTQNPRAKNIRASALAQRVRQCITLE